MKTHFKLLGAIGILAAILVTATSVPAMSDPIVGHWTAPDTFDNDGSTSHMVISPGPGGTYLIHGWDNPSTSGCPVTNGLGTIEGTAILDGTTIVKTVVASCPSEGTSGSPTTHEMLYDATTNTIYDTDFNLTYTK